MDYEKWYGMETCMNMTTKEGYPCLKITGALQKDCSVSQNIFTRIEKKVGVVYTFSAWILVENIKQGTTNPLISLYMSGTYQDDSGNHWLGATLDENDGSILDVNGQGWVKVWYTFHFDQVPVEMTALIFARDFTGEIYVRNAKLELGNQCTDWTPAPEDMDDKIADVVTEAEQKIQSAKSEILQTTDSIKQSVTSLESTVKNHTTQIAGKADSQEVEELSSKATELETGLSGITGRVSKTESSVSTINGTITSLTSRVTSAEQKITDEAITQTVSKTFATKESVDGKVDKSLVVSQINQSAEAIKISASKLELTGNVTFTMFDSQTQKKITDAQSNASVANEVAKNAQSSANEAKTAADSAKATATSAQNTANAVNNTVTSNKANWDKGVTAYNWTNSYGSRTNNLYAMVTKWTDEAVSTTTQINGGWIKTNTITASKIAVGDWTNYATVNEHSEESMLPASFKFGGTKRWNPSGIWELQRYDYTKSNYLMLCDYTPSCFKVGDKIRFQFQIYPMTTGNKSVAIYFYDEDKVHLGSHSADFTAAKERWSDISIMITIGSIPVNAQYFVLGFDFHNTSGNDAIRKCSVRKMMTGDMIVDGSITASKINVSDLSALKATIGGWTIGPHYLSTKVGSNYSVLKNDGDVAFATASPSASDTTGASCQIWHDGHISLGDTKNSRTRTEIYGDRFNMYNSQGFAFRLVSAGGIEFYGDPTQNPTPYMDWHYNGDTGDYSVRLRCTGYDTLIVEGGTLNTGSDERLKKNMEQMKEPYLILFDNLNPITYQYLDHTMGKIHCGFSAQAVEKAAAQAGLNINALALYAMDEDGYRSLAYQEFIAIQTLAIKRNRKDLLKLTEKMEHQKSEIVMMKGRVDQLQSLLNQAWALMAKHGIQQEIE